MPNYDFKCLDCAHQFKALLPVGTKETKCLECGKGAQKLLAAPDVHFKGSGFYKTDSGAEAATSQKNSSDKTE